MSLFPTLGRLQLVVLLCATLVGVATVNADTLIVTNTADTGAGSLRAAIAAAGDGDTIQFVAALNGQSITLTSGELAIGKNITIDGPGANQLAVTKPSGTLDFRIFHVLLGHFFTIKNLTIDGNGTPGAGIWSNGATVALDKCVVQGCLGSGVRCYASFNDDSYLSVSNSTIRNNHADTSGGGIYNEAVTGAHAILTISNSVVTNNNVGSFSGTAGGGIWNSGEMDITNSVVSNNVSGGNGPDFPFGEGGGIWNTGFTMFIADSTISGNSAGLNGGGIYSRGVFVSIGSSTISGNSAIGLNELEGWGEGAGIHNGGGSLTLTNSTVSNNTSTRSGGGVSNRGVMVIHHSTFNNNSGIEGLSIANYSASLEIGNTVLKCVAAGGINLYNNSGTVTSNGYNLCSDNGGGLLTATGDQINTEPMLGPLQNNGGPTFTHELLTGSPAIDTGNPSFTPPPANDQRGPLYQRVFNGRIDIGSLEVQSTPPTPTPTVTPVPAGADLALTESDSPDPVQVGGNLTYTITIFNLAPNIATAASVVDTLPAGVNFVSATPSQGSCTGTSTVVCEMGSLQGGVSVTISLVVTPTAAGMLSNTATVSGFEDPNPSNNSDTELTTVNSIPTPTPTPTATPPATPTPTPSPTATPSSTAAQALNISTRLRIGTGDRIAVGGFIITGNEPKTVALRGIGPSLLNSGLTDVLADPVLELRGPDGALLRQNDNWQDDAFGGKALFNLGLGLHHYAESGFVVTLKPGPYTALLAGKNQTSGLGLVEIYDVDTTATDSQLANISTRGFVQTDDGVLIGGFILGRGGNSTQVAVRGIGPSLAQAGLSPVLADPTLELRDSEGALLISNDNWQDDPEQAMQLSAQGLAPTDAHESGIFAFLPPGTFTVILAGKNNGTGIGLVEIYNVR